MATYEESDFGLFLRASQHDRDGLMRDLKSMIAENFVVRFRVVTETSRGETIRNRVAPLLDYKRFINSLFPSSPA